MTTDSEAVIAKANAMRQWAEGDGGLFEAFDAVEADYFDLWSNSTVEDYSKRESLWHRLHALRDLRRRCQIIINEGRAEIIKQSKRNEGKVSRHV